MKESVTVFTIFFNPVLLSCLYFYHVFLSKSSDLVFPRNDHLFSCFTVSSTTNKLEVYTNLEIKLMPGSHTAPGREQACAGVLRRSQLAMSIQGVSTSYGEDGEPWPVNQVCILRLGSEGLAYLIP